MKKLGVVLLVALLVSVSSSFVVAKVKADPVNDEPAGVVIPAPLGPDFGLFGKINI